MDDGEPAMIWIGGAQGSGKSTLARRLAIAYDLPLHPIDRWTYVHAARQVPGPSLDDQLAAGPEQAAGTFLDAARMRLSLVLADVADRALGAVPAVVEGPQLLPELAGDLPVGYAVWLLPTPERTRCARQERLTSVDDLRSRSRLEALVLRDTVIADRIRASATATSRPVIEVADEPDWEAVLAAVEAILAPALRAGPRLATGEELRRQRRFENAAAAEQISRWAAATELAEDPVFAFSCECGTTGCDLVQASNAHEYRQQAAAGPVLASRHRARSTEV